ncbi:MAG: hypothetical protein L7U72_11990 [Rubripirellula sp.]|nr:hypothetical protein [Rubripirellula sp.]
MPSLKLHLMVFLGTTILGVASLQAQTTVQAGGESTTLSEPVNENPSPPSQVDTANVSENPADQSSEKTSIKESQRVPLGVTPSGVQRHISGMWATIAVNGVNSTETDAEETLLLTLDGNEADQVTRKLWIPAGARRQAWFPVLIPETDPDQIQVIAQTIQIAESDSGETFQSNRVGSPTSQRSLLLSPPEDQQAAMMLDSVFAIDAAKINTDSMMKMIYYGFDSATNVRQDLGMTRFSGHFLPTTANPLDSLDNLIIADDRLIHDTTGINRLRQWLNDGGRVWLMADRVSSDSVRALLGDAVHYSELDRVELNEFTLEKLDPFFSTVSLQEQWTSESPVTLVRVMIDAGEIDSRVDGWPAAFWVPAGKGEILVTTLGHEGWMFNDKPTEIYRALASRFFVEREPAPNNTEAMLTELNREIGYQIPGRGLIIFLLVGHLSLLGVAGSVLSRKRALHHLGWILPSSVLVSVVILLIVGKTNTSAIPSTIAIGQIARAIPETSQLQIDSTLAVYSQSPSDLPIKSDSNVVTQLADNWSSNETRRQQFTDDGIAEWKFLTQPPGKIQHLHVATRQSMKTPWQVLGTFNQSGFTGQLLGLDTAQASDAIILSAASPAMSLSLDAGQGLLNGGAEQTLLPGQFYDGSLLSDTQRQRQSFIRRLMETNNDLQSAEPSLLIWTAPVSDGLKIPEQYERRGWALASLPIRIESPESGVEFTVPPAFIKLDSYRGDRGISTLYNAETGQWLESVDKPAEIDLRAQLPRAVASSKITACDIDLHANAQGRNIRIFGFVDGEKRLLHEVQNSQGLNEFTIETGEVLELDPRGGFRLSVEVTPTEQERLEAESESNSPTESPTSESVAAASAPSEEIKTQVTKENSVTWVIKYLQVSVHAQAE